MGRARGDEGGWSNEKSGLKVRNLATRGFNGASKDISES